MRLSRQKQLGFRVRWIDHDHGTMHVANGIQTDLGTYSYLLTPHRRSNDRRLTDRSDDQSAKLPSKTHFQCDPPLPASSTFYIPSIRASFVVALSARTRNSVCPSTIGTKNMNTCICTEYAKIEARRSSFGNKIGSFNSGSVQRVKRSLTCQLPSRCGN